MQMVNHILKSNIETNVNFKGNFGTSKKLFYIDHGSDMINYILD